MHFVYILKFRDRDKPNSMFYTGETVENKQEGKKREQEIKALTHNQKKELIASDKNNLLRCEPNFGKPKICLK